MHLGVVVTNYPPHLGGVEAHVEALAREISRKGEQVTVVCLGDVPSETVRDGVRVMTLRRRLDLGGVIAVPTRTQWRAARRMLAGSGVSHLSVHTRFFPMTWLGLRLAKDLDVPVVLTEHGGGHVATSSAVVTRGAYGVDHTAGRWALRTADHLLAVSSTAASFVRALAGRQSTVLGNGVDAAFWAAGRSAPRRHVVFAGRLVPEKGWREFLVILAGLSPDVTATVAGDGPDLAALRQAIRGLGLEPRVEVTGRLAQPLLRAAYAGSVYVNPSRAAEGFQTTLLEAGLAGARIATYDVGGAAEVVGSGGAAGRVVPAGDVSALRLAVSQLLEGETTSCPEVLWQYDWPRLADRFLAELIGARP